MLFKKKEKEKQNDIEIMDLDLDEQQQENISAEAETKEENKSSEETKTVEETKSEEIKMETESEEESKESEEISEVTEETSEDKEESKEENKEENKEEDSTDDSINDSEEKTEDESKEDKTEEKSEEVQEEVKEESEETKPKKKILKFIGRFFAFLGVTLLMIIMGLYVVMWICTKGPSSQIKELFVLSVRESSAGGFLADIYLTPEEIAAIEEKNSVQELNEVTDTSIVQIAVKQSSSEGGSDIGVNDDNGYIAESSFDVNIYTENGIEFHEIAGTTFTGIAMVVSDPSRVFIGTPRDTYDGGPGISVPAIADRYGAIAATNGGFFVDTGGHGDGGTPIGCVFSNGKMVYGSTGAYYNIMGFNEEGVLICGYMSGQSAIDLGIRDGLQCNPFLIINGEGVNVGGKGGGLNPRTALGQRADGAVVLLTIDGRQASSLGASMSDMVDVMLSFDVVNAGNLDGGGSTVLYYNGEIQNVVMSIYGARGVPNAVCVRPE